MASRLDAHAEWVISALNEYEVALVRFVITILHDVERAREVVQEGFLKLVRTAPGEVDRDKVKAWLFQVCRNGALDVLRKDERLVFADELPLSGETTDEREWPDERAARREDMLWIRDAVEELPRNQQEVVRLRYEHDLAYAEIAQVTGLSVSNVGFLLHSALKGMRGRYERERGEDGLAMLAASGQQGAAAAGNGRVGSRVGAKRGRVQRGGVGG